MEGMVTWATGIRTVMGAMQEVRIGGTKVHHATTKLLLFWCLVTVTWVNHFSFFCHWWNKFNWKLLHWQNLASNHLASFENCWRRLLEWSLLLHQWSYKGAVCNTKKTTWPRKETWSLDSSLSSVAHRESFSGNRQGPSQMSGQGRLLRFFMDKLLNCCRREILMFLWSFNWKLAIVTLLFFSVARHFPKKFPQPGSLDT